MSRTMHRMTAFVDHWFTNICVWMLVCRQHACVKYYTPTVTGHPHHNHYHHIVVVVVNIRDVVLETEVLVEDKKMKSWS